MPIWNCFKFEKSLAVRQSCLETYLYLIYHLSFDAPTIETNFDTIVVPALVFDSESKTYESLLSAAGTIKINTSEACNTSHHRIA
jgi:hypothetical protein